MLGTRVKVKPNATVADIVQEYVFYVFLKIQKTQLLRFFEAAFQKNVKKRNP